MSIEQFLAERHPDQVNEYINNHQSNNQTRQTTNNQTLRKRKSKNQN